MRARLGLSVLLVCLIACGGDSPQPLGPLESKIITGRALSVTAGQWTTTHTVNLSYRNIATASRQPSLMERVLLPAVAFAQTVGIKVQPNSVACVSEDQMVLVPFTRCVNSDSIGQSRFDFIPTHVAGVHTARLNATYGLEATTFDTVTITVVADVADPNYQIAGGSTLFSPAVVPDNAMADKYGNPVAFRIVSDANVTAQDTTTGSVGARTLVLVGGTNNVEYITTLLGANGVKLGSFAYRPFTNSAGLKSITWRSVGTAITP